jgi:hypothetical protein
MDSLDCRLYRAMFSGNVQSIHGFDPRLSVQDLSRSTGISRVTVRRRLARWRDDGFWKGVVAFPNPDTLGTFFQMQSVKLEPGRGRSRSESALIDLLRPALLFQSEDVYNPLLLAEPRATSERRQREFQERGGGRALCPPLDFPMPASTVRLALRDWKIIRSLRRFPHPDWPAVAKEVGITLRGVQRRVTRLMQGKALCFFPELDFRRSPGTFAWIGILFGVGVDSARLRADLTQRFPDLVRVEPVFPFEHILPPSDRPTIGGRFPFQISVASASVADQLRRDLIMIPGVVDVLVGFPTQNFSVPEVFDTRIDAAIHGLSEMDSSVSSTLNT